MIEGDISDDQMTRFLSAEMVGKAVLLTVITFFESVGCVNCLKRKNPRY